MEITRIIFYSFSALALFSAAMMVLCKNPVKALLCLGLVFCAYAGLWVLLQAEFLAMILVLVYVGAIMVLFLFVVMMLDIEKSVLKEGRTFYFLLGIAAYFIMSGLLLYIVNPTLFGVEYYPEPMARSYSLNNLGLLLYTEYLYPFIIAGVLLLVAMIAAIALTLRKRPHSKKVVDLAAIQKTSKANRLRIVSMPSFREIP